MQEKYKDMIDKTMEEGSILDTMLTVQKLDGYVTEAALKAIAEAYGITPSKAYETASFYSMVKLRPTGKVAVEICRGAPCHVAGAKAVIDKVEAILGISVGSTSADGLYSFEYTECLGQCQAGPAMLINGKLHKELTVACMEELLKREGVQV